MAPLVLTKFDVAERQLLQAIRLFFAGGDPVSVHTVSEAAAQVLYDIRGFLGIENRLRDSDLIRSEYRREWLATLGRSRNFFKHADRDPSDVHEFKDEFNHFSLLDGVGMYGPAKGSWTPETIVFLQMVRSNVSRTDSARPKVGGRDAATTSGVEKRTRCA